MPLKFPNARLFMHNLLADGRVSGAEAIALSACEFGLLNQADADGVRSTTATTRCKCMEAGRKVLVKYFEQHAAASSSVADKVWSAIEEDARRYGCARGNSISSTGDCYRHDCAKFAPALFDILLQQITRYHC